MIVLTHCQHRVLAFLRYFSDRGRGQISTRALARELQMTRRTVQAAIAALNEAGFILTDASSRKEPSLHRVLPRSGAR